MKKPNPNKSKQCLWIYSVWKVKCLFLSFLRRVGHTANGEVIIWKPDLGETVRAMHSMVIPPSPSPGPVELRRAGSQEPPSLHRTRCSCSLAVLPNQTDPFLFFKPLSWWCTHSSQGFLDFQILTTVRQKLWFKHITSLFQCDNFCGFSAQILK